MSNIAVKWTGEGSQMFIGRDSFGHIVVSGSWPSDDPEWQEWKGLKPSDLLLISLASCSAYDVVNIMQRQRQKLRDLCVNVQGQQEPQPPYCFTHIHLHYILEGEALDSRKVERAIRLSQDKYCSVAATIRGVARLSYTYEIK
ncbi:MAG: OsmC family protein [Chloroflexi bacterium]|nr:OsmC family protein [Chloroflexota bacterium]MCI0580048.1 OsmC family protein [Chloroflexota bacterium]MCI0649760.1 OsmC family protein [Chloroflexota bacterium]MCI0730215.1 OsmC family protein [Chloroflexota bacterium]